MQIINPSSGSSSLALRASLLADFTAPFVSPMNITWTAGNFTVGQPTRITVPAGYTKARVILSATGAINAAAGSVRIDIVMNGNSASPATAYLATQVSSAVVGGFTGFGVECTSAKVAVIAGDYFTARFNYVGVTPVSITALPATFFEVELFN